MAFVLRAAERISNPVLEKRFAIMKAKMAKLGDKSYVRERVSFHGSHPRNVQNICKTSLLRFKHPLNPCKQQVDDGYFGTNKKVSLDLYLPLLLYLMHICMRLQVLLWVPLCMPRLASIQHLCLLGGCDH